MCTRIQISAKSYSRHSNPTNELKMSANRAENRAVCCLLTTAYHDVEIKRVPFIHVLIARRGWQSPASRRSTRASQYCSNRPLSAFCKRLWSVNTLRCALHVRPTIQKGRWQAGSCSTRPVRSRAIPHSIVQEYRSLRVVLLRLAGGTIHRPRRAAGVSGECYR